VHFALFPTKIWGTMRDMGKRRLTAGLGAVPMQHRRHQRGMTDRQTHTNTQTPDHYADLLRLLDLYKYVYAIVIVG